MRGGDPAYGQGFTYGDVMHSDVIQSAIRWKKVNLYRRVSTAKQAKDGYKHQLECIQAEYPEFTISNNTNISVKEPISGRSDMEIRVATGLGKCLRHLVHNPSEFLLVSSCDRIARRKDVFELIKDLGLGHRIYDVSTGMNVNDIIKAGLHHTVEQQSEEKHDAHIASIERRKAYGKKLGSPHIAKHSKKGTTTKTRLADEREAQVLSIVTTMTFHGGGKKPSYAEISDELNKQCIPTGQNRLWTPVRVGQLRKRSPEKWDYAFDSCHRPKRRIRELVTNALIEVRNKRTHRRRRIWLSSQTIIHHRWLSLVGGSAPHPSQTNRCVYTNQNLIEGGREGCRGPPALLRRALKVAKNVLFGLTRMCWQPTVQRRH